MKGLIKLVKPYNGKDDICKWLDKFNTLMQLQKFTGDTSEYIPYFLEGDAYELYSQLEPDVIKSGEKLEKALKKSFGLDSFEAFEALRSKRWNSSETVDVYLAGIQRLASLCDIKSKEFVLHSFVTGLPEDTARNLRTQAQLSSKSLSEIVEITRVLLKDKRNDGATFAIRTQNGGTGAGTQQIHRREFKCNKCLSTGHTAKYCRSAEDRRKCFKCNQYGHIAINCRVMGNDNGEYPAPVISQNQ